MIPADLLELLRCPQSGQEFLMAGPDVLGPLNDRVTQVSPGGQGVRTVGGVLVEQPLTAALLRIDRLVLYPIRDGIPVLLVEDGIRL